jgi:hypothetical protein
MVIWLGLQRPFERFTVKVAQVLCFTQPRNISLVAIPLFYSIEISSILLNQIITPRITHTIQRNNEELCNVLIPKKLDLVVVDEERQINQSVIRIDEELGKF